MTRKATTYAVVQDDDRLIVVRTAARRGGMDDEVVLDAAGPAARAELARLAGGQAFFAGCIPVEKSVTRWLTAPFPSVRKAVKVLPSLLDIQLPFPVESCVCDFLRVHRSGEHVRALAVASRREMIEQRLAEYRELGVDPVVLDQEGLALWAQSIEELPIEPDITRIVVCAGASRTVFAVGRGLEFDAAHACQVGMRELASETGRAPGGGVSLQAFAGRVEQILRAHAPDDAGQSLQWVWAGPGAQDESACAAAQEALRLERPVTFVRHRDPASFLGRALARRALAHGPTFCNLRSGTLTHPRQQGLDQAAQVKSAVRVLLLGVLLCGLNGAWRLAVAGREARIQEAITQAAKDLTGGERLNYGQELLQAQRAIEQRAPRQAPFVRAFSPSLTVLLAEILSIARQGGMTLEKLSLSADSAAAAGSSEKWDDCKGISEALGRHGFRADQPEQRDAGADERVHFSLKAVAGD